MTDAMGYAWLSRGPFHLDGEAAVPLLVSADLEGLRMSLPLGTQVPNPLALACHDVISGATKSHDA